MHQKLILKTYLAPLKRYNFIVIRVILHKAQSQKPKETENWNVPGLQTLNNKVGSYLK